jgi:hypothetical protein
MLENERQAEGFLYIHLLDISNKASFLAGLQAEFRA